MSRLYPLFAVDHILLTSSFIYFGWSRGGGSGEKSFLFDAQQRRGKVGRQGQEGGEGGGFSGRLDFVFLDCFFQQYRLTFSFIYLNFDSGLVAVSSLFLLIANAKSSPTPLQHRWPLRTPSAIYRTENTRTPRIAAKYSRRCGCPKHREGLHGVGGGSCGC